MPYIMLQNNFLFEFRFPQLDTHIDFLLFEYGSTWTLNIVQNNIPDIKLFYSYQK